MFQNILCILILSSYHFEFGLCNGRDYIEWNKDSDLYVKKHDFDQFKRAMFEELQNMKDGDEKLRDDITRLKTENVNKEKRINELEQKLASVQTEQCKGIVRRSIPYFETIGFTAYLDHGVHNLTHDQPVNFNKVSIHLRYIHNYEVKIIMMTTILSNWGYSNTRISRNAF